MAKPDPIMIEPINKPSPMQSLIAGMTAGAVEALVTYPFEYCKTQLQLGGKYTGLSHVLRGTLSERGLTGLYQGVSPMMIGNAAKAGVRFLAFDSYLNALQGIPMASVLAGLGAGMTEAILVVTPAETIKTKLIDDSNGAQRYRGLLHGVRTIVAESGLSGIYKGLWPVMMRQGANSAVRMSTYGTIRDAISGWYPQVDGVARLPFYASFLTGSVSGIVTVFSTMPFDVVKTRMQSLDAARYRHSWHCGLEIVKSSGIKGLWKGSLPRLMRLIVLYFKSSCLVGSCFQSMSKSLFLHLEDCVIYSYLYHSFIIFMT